MPSVVPDPFDCVTIYDLDLPIPAVYVLQFVVKLAFVTLYLLAFVKFSNRMSLTCVVSSIFQFTIDLFRMLIRIYYTFIGLM